MKVKIMNFPETKVAVIKHRGSPETKHESIKKMVAWRIESKLPLDKHQVYGVHYDDPSTTPPEKYRMDLCISVESNVAENIYGVINKSIPSGKCAVARHIGSRENVVAATYLYREWLPKSGEKLRDFPVFFHYVNVGPNVSEEEMITDVYLPIQ
jgi:AraC family transcriptional regulator